MKFAKWIFIGLGNLIAIMILAFMIFTYIFYYEKEFTKNSIYYYFLTENMQSKFIISPKTEPIYECSEHDNGGRRCEVRYKSLLSKGKLETKFDNMGYIYSRYGYLSDMQNKTEIKISDDSSVMISEIE